MTTVPSCYAARTSTFAKSNPNGKPHLRNLLQKIFQFLPKCFIVEQGPISTRQEIASNAARLDGVHSQRKLIASAFLDLIQSAPQLSMMPAKLQLERTADLAVQRSSWNAKR
nr:CNT_HP1_G0038130.mRNA.1.CDS.1 [Saccharomyces cerevisiae]